MLETILLWTLMFLLSGIVLAVLLIVVLHFFGWMITGVPYVPIPRNTLLKLPEALELTDDSVVYDLGCGDGRVLYELAKKSNARFIGIEYAPQPYLLAKFRGMLERQKNVQILCKDFLEISLKNATHAYVYLFPQIMDTLLPKLEKELRPGTRVVSCDFRFKNREPSRTILCGAKKNGHKLHVYDF